MKVIIHSNIIDTKDIFSIGEIYPTNDCTLLQFEIQFYNIGVKYISIPTFVPEWQVSDKYGIMSYSEYIEYIKKTDILKKRLETFSKGRQQLIDIWSDNQNNILKIKLE